MLKRSVLSFDYICGTNVTVTEDEVSVQSYSAKLCAVRINNCACQDQCHLGVNLLEYPNDREETVRPILVDVPERHNGYKAT